MSLERSKTFETNSPERGTNSYSLFVLMGMGGSPTSETLCVTFYACDMLWERLLGDSHGAVVGPRGSLVVFGVA